MNPKTSVAAPGPIGAIGESTLKAADDRRLLIWFLSLVSGLMVWATVPFFRNSDQASPSHPTASKESNTQPAIVTQPPAVARESRIPELNTNYEAILRDYPVNVDTNCAWFYKAFEAGEYAYCKLFYARAIAHDDFYTNGQKMVILRPYYAAAEFALNPTSAGWKQFDDTFRQILACMEESRKVRKAGRDNYGYYAYHVYINDTSRALAKIRDMLHGDSYKEHRERIDELIKKVDEYKPDSIR